MENNQPKSEEVKPKILRPKPMLYAFYFSILQEKAKELGYNLIIHGSMNRDCDLVAVAWTDNAVDSVELIDAIHLILKGQSVIEYAGRENVKEVLGYSLLQGGRDSFVINLNRGGMLSINPHHDPEYYLDISVVNTSARIRELEERVKIEAIVFAEFVSDNFQRAYPKQDDRVLWFPQITYDGVFEKRLYTTGELILLKEFKSYFDKYTKELSRSQPNTDTV